jgi:DNA-binding NarL/FixJ family response regulator
LNGGGKLPLANNMSDYSPGECKKRVDLLSPQMREVLRLMVQGLATKQIADTMGLSEPTVRTYRERVYSKLAVNNLALAIRVAVRAGLQ